MSPEDGAWDVFRARGGARLDHGGRIAALDRLAGLAGRVLGAPAALVRLPGEEPAVIGAAGLAAVPGALTAAAEAACDEAARTGSVVRGEDGAGARLAVPVRAPGGRGSARGADGGALCVFGPVARRWTDEDVSLLRSLAQSVAVELELAVLESEYAGDREIWQLAMDAGGVGAFDWDLLTGELRWDERLLELFGLDRAGFGGTIEAFNAAVHPDDRDRVAQALRGAIETVGDYTAEYRVVLPSGEVRWIAARGRALAGPDGRAVRLLGAATDTTAVQGEETRVARVLESMPMVFFSLDRSWRFTYANGEAKRLLGGIGSDIVGGELWELFPAAVGSEFERQYRHAMATGEPVMFEAYYPPPLDAHYEVRGWPTPDGLSVYFIDVTARHEAQALVAKAARRSALLAEATAELAGAWDVDRAVGRLAQLIAPELGQWCLVTLTDGGEISSPDWRRGLRDVGWWHAEESQRPLVERYREVRLDALTDGSFFRRALTGQEPVVVEQDAAEAVASVLVEGEARRLCLALAPRAVVALAMRARGRTLGVLTVFRGEDELPFAPDDLAVLKDLADRAGLALDNARLHAQQRDLAEELQRSLMTAPPTPDHLRIAVRYQPAAEVAQVGGDWYDAFVQPEGATVVVIGDVIGHDTAAAAAMGQIRNVLRGVAVATGSSPAGLLRQVDRVMSSLLIEITATVVVARLEQTPGEREAGLTRLRWSNAGHPPPIAVDHARADEPLRAEVLWGAGPNLLLGLEPDVRRDENVVTLRRGSTLLFYTDGLVERRGELIDRGIERLAGILTELVGEGVGLEELCDELLRRMLPDKPDDDVALVAVTLDPQDRPAPA